MKRFTIISLVMAAMLVFGAGNAMAIQPGLDFDYASGSNTMNNARAYISAGNVGDHGSDLNGEDYAETSGAANYTVEANAHGTKSAYVRTSAFGGWDGTRVGAIQQERNGGELSAAGAASFTGVTASAKMRSRDWNGNVGPKDYMSIEVGGAGSQANHAFSDDNKLAEVGAGNFSSFGFELGNKASRNDDQFRTVSGYGGALGGSVVYAKNTDDKGFVGGLTASASFVGQCGAEPDKINTNVAGQGGISGYTITKNQTSYASFNADYSYNGVGPVGGGVAGGYGRVKTSSSPGKFNLSGSSAGFAASGVGTIDRNIDRAYIGGDNSNF